MDGDAVDVPRLVARFKHYVDIHRPPAAEVTAMLGLLASSVGRRVCALSKDELTSHLLDDAYKLKMHAMYAEFATGVTADFVLKIRRTPMPLSRLRSAHPSLWRALLDDVSRLTTHTPALPADEVNALAAHFDFVPTQAMMQRAERDGVAPVTWVDINGEPTAVASGPIEAASHAETSVMQLVQEYLILAQQQQQQVEEEEEQQVEEEEGARRRGGDETTASNGGSTSSNSSAASPRGDGGGRCGVVPLDRTERLANSLCKLCLVAGQLNELQRTAGFNIALFAGRRSSDRAYLLLQNLFFAAHVAGYRGTSSVFAATLADRLSREAAAEEAEELEAAQAPGGLQSSAVGDAAAASSTSRRGCDGAVLPSSQTQQQQQQQLVMVDAPVGRLIGTHAHEQSSMMQQLLVAYDLLAGRLAAEEEEEEETGSGSSEAAAGKESEPGTATDIINNKLTAAASIAPGRPQPQPQPAICVTSLLAHLLFLVANGGFDSGGGTALADTFATSSFVAVAAAADVPDEMRSDVAARWGHAIHPRAKCFDLFRLWRLDSGDYAQVADSVMSAWEARCVAAADDGCPLPPRPIFMHSDLGGVEDIRKAAALPERIRPSWLGFGSLADGFLPFDLRQDADDNRGGGAAAAAASIRMASLVMKAVQARAAKLPGPPMQASAVKLGDDPGHSKIQVDPRLQEEEQRRVIEFVSSMARTLPKAPSQPVSRALARAYHAVTRGRVLMLDY